MLHAKRRHTKKCDRDQKKKHEKNLREPLKFSPKELKKCNFPPRVVGVDTVNGIGWRRLKVA
jgi:hypothetical protein